MFKNLQNIFKSLPFQVKLSIIVLIVILAWIVAGMLFKEKSMSTEAKAVGEGKVGLLASEIQSSQVYKVITGYGNIDRDRIDVISEINSHVSDILKQEGSKISKNEPVIALLSDIRIPSPINGRLDRISVNRGDIVFAGQTLLFSVISASKLDAVLHVSATDARFIKPQNEAIIQAQESIYRGSVYFVSKISNKQNNSFEVKIKITDALKSEELFHDETVRISINTILKTGFFVPTSAISINSKDETMISYIDAEGKLKKAKVEILQTFSSGIWVSGEDLPEKALIIIRGGDFAKEGDIPTYTLETFEQKYYDI